MRRRPASSADSRYRTTLPIEASRSIRAIRAAHRALTGGPDVRDAQRRTILAVSGGADSSALALALAKGRPRSALDFLIVHVLHDLRPRDIVLNEARAVEALGAKCGVPVLHMDVSVSDRKGNAEANARAARYAALLKAGRQHKIRYIATAHHADDALETLLMRILRGSGPAGLAGIRESRRVCDITIIRPMLGITHADALALCAAHHWQSSDDATNRETTRLRARLRAQVVPILREIRPTAPHAAVRVSRTQAQIAAASRSTAKRFLAKYATTDASSVTIPTPALARLHDHRLHAVLDLLLARARTRAALAPRERFLARLRKDTPHAATMDLGRLKVRINQTQTVFGDVTPLRLA